MTSEFFYDYLFTFGLLLFFLFIIIFFSSNLIFGDFLLTYLFVYFDFIYSCLLISVLLNSHSFPHFLYIKLKFINLIFIFVFFFSFVIHIFSFIYFICCLFITFLLSSIKGKQIAFMSLNAGLNLAGFCVMY